MSSRAGSPSTVTARLRLRPLREPDEQAVRAAHESIRQHDEFDFALGLRPGMSWSQYLQALDDYRRGVNLPDGLVPATFLAAAVGGELVGRVSIRHTLNDYLRQRGGHIGYAVLAQHRRRGYGTEMLRQSLSVAYDLGIDRILITCDDTNLGSRRIIETCGGTFESITPWTDGTLQRRYWIRHLGSTTRPRDRPARGEGVESVDRKECAPMPQMSLFDHLTADATRDGVQQLVVGAVIACDGKVLLLRRPSDDFMGGIWELPSGKVEPGEELDRALIREVKEETGLDVLRIGTYLGAFDYISGSGKKSRQFNFTVDVYAAEPVALQEHDDYAWIDPTGEPPVTEAVKPILQRYQAE
ncbi:GNAT family N-acetyltransferase [Nocardia sp. CDC159]|uniref:GNAT family N-acetyltransferase n=1 Tax=Nocardia pulmonis TaxID=2951408 RepID=A0A9X2IXC0_9NOCA|nr:MULTISPECIES: GNAT family N-acetyltransferase [Nocardia]MCM6774474.1 GNAT family N-acetyltransferase [Nocardia pulmonis]MCM6787460.1 GNAT family N-acetyltransferase [Nocardia sp. CDC159]